MKNIVIALLLLTTIGYSQSIERQVIGSAGTTLTDGATASIDFTVGELVVSTITDGTTTLTQGFHQGEIQLAINLSAVAFLQGAALSPNTGEESLMRDDLRVSGDVPTTSPYTDAITCVATVLNTGGTSGTGDMTDDIVDWVFVELRDETTNTTVLYSQSALLQRDGDIVGVDGTSALSFTAASGNYHVAIKHRNHLGIMSASTIALSATTTEVNFTNSTSQITYGSNAQTSFGMTAGLVGMWAGDVNGDSIIQYTGATPDSPSILSNALNDAGNFLNLPTYVVTGYNVNDVDMNGDAQYTGSSPDTPYILQNTLSHSGNFLNLSTYSILEQIPQQ
ncbi:MAG: hemagglutinin protein [Flavobacteriaceae bacterium]|nr:hemagglutinin protein [Flavobacteriaceae bacterium]